MLFPQLLKSSLNPAFTSIKSISGLGLTITGFVLVLEHPFLSITVSVTLKFLSVHPKNEYVWVGFSKDEVVPSSIRYGHFSKH